MHHLNWRADVACEQYFWIFPQVPEGQEFVMKTIAGTKWVIDQM
jgi:hypothetical protein